MLRARLAFPEAPTSALDPCCGTGAALHALTTASNTTPYGVELDANRAASAKESGIQTSTATSSTCALVSNAFRSSISTLPMTSRWTAPMNEWRSCFSPYLCVAQAQGRTADGYSCNAVYDVADTLSTRFKEIAIYRLVGVESEKYNQCAVFGIRHNNNDTKPSSGGKISRG